MQAHVGSRRGGGGLMNVLGVSTWYTSSAKIKTTLSRKFLFEKQISKFRKHGCYTAEQRLTWPFWTRGKEEVLKFLLPVPTPVSLASGRTQINPQTVLFPRIEIKGRSKGSRRRQAGVNAHNMESWFVRKQYQTYVQSIGFFLIWN